MSVRLVLLVLLALAPSAAAADWPMIHRDGGNGGTLDGASLGHPWSVVLPNESIGERTAPIVVGGFVALAGLDVHVYDLRSGVARWSYALSPDGFDFLLPATSDGSRLFVAEWEAVRAFQLADGQTAWTFQLDNRTATPVVHARGTAVFGSTDGRIFAVSTQDGGIRWQAQVAGLRSTSFAIQNGLVLVAAERGGLHAFRLADGAEAWRVETSGAPSSFLVASDGILLVPVGAQGTGEVHAFDVATGRRLWTVPADVAHGGSLAAADGRAYARCAASVLCALDLRTGTKIWSAERCTPFIGTPSPRGDTLLVGDGMCGTIDVLDAKTGRLLRQRQLHAFERIESGPVAGAGDVVVLAHEAPEWTGGAARAGRSVHLEAFRVEDMEQLSFDTPPGFWLFAAVGSVGVTATAYVVPRWRRWMAR